MQLIWIITTEEDGEPIIAASSQENATQQLFDYMGYPDVDKNVKYFGFKKYIYSEYEDDYVGIYTFEDVYDHQTDNFRLYCKALDASQK